MQSHEMIELFRLSQDPRSKTMIMSQVRNKKEVNRDKGHKMPSHDHSNNKNKQKDTDQEERQLTTDPLNKTTQTVWG